jgi:hypothetical protein
MMSDAYWDAELRPAPDADRRNAVARTRIRECMEVSRLTYEGLPRADIATRLGFTERKVRDLQLWLGQLSRRERREAGCTEKASSSRRLDARSETETG